MRALLLLTLLGACASEPSIACTSDDHCLSGQLCASGWCATAATSTMPDAPEVPASDATHADAPTTMPDAPPPSCAPACSGAKPYCHEGACVECTMPLHCPLTAPRCVANACTL